MSCQNHWILSNLSELFELPERCFTNTPNIRGFPKVDHSGSCASSHYLKDQDFKDP